MNKNLTKEIVLHLFSNFGILSSDYVNLNNLKSLKSKEFLLEEKLNFEIAESIISIENKVWGCELNISGNSIKALLGDCSLDENNLEYSLLFIVKDAPMYGLYWSIDDSFICYSLDGKNWALAKTALQAMFLAGTEDIRELGMRWDRASDNVQSFAALKSFVSFIDKLIGDSSDEG